MGAVYDQAVVAFDDYNTHGVSGSGVKRPVKADIREMARLIDAGRMWSITDFGCVGDGNEAGTSGTDNTSTLSSAIDSGESLFIPSGKFLHDADAIVMTTDGQRIVGNGRQKSFLICPTSTGRAWKVEGVSRAEMSGLSMKFADAVARTSGQKLLSLESSDNCTFSHLDLRYGNTQVDIESCIDMTFDHLLVLAGALGIRVAATLATYAHTCNNLYFKNVNSQSNTAGMIRVDQSGSENISSIALVDCGTSEDGTVSSGNYSIDLRGMVKGGATSGARISGLWAEGLPQALLRFDGPVGDTNSFRTFSMRDSTIIVPGASAYTLSLIGVIDHTVVDITGVNAISSGATHTFDFGAATAGECRAGMNQFGTTCTKNVSSAVDIT